MKGRGLVTSLGAGGSLIAAVLCALVLVGGIIAVGGGVGGSARAESGDIVMPAGAGAATAAVDGFAGAPLAFAFPPGPAAADSPRAARRLPAERRTRRRPTPSPDDASSTPAPLAPSSGGGSTPSAPSASPPSPSPPAEPEPVSETVSVRRVVQQTRQTVAPVVDVAPEPVQPAVDDVADTVERVAGTVDETVAPITGLVP